MQLVQMPERSPSGVPLAPHSDLSDPQAPQTRQEDPPGIGNEREHAPATAGLADPTLLVRPVAVLRVVLSELDQPFDDPGIVRPFLLRDRRSRESFTPPRFVQAGSVHHCYCQLLTFLRHHGRSDRGDVRVVDEQSLDIMLKR